MYQVLLTLHSLGRWIVLLAMIITIAIALIRFFNEINFQRRDFILIKTTATVVQIQFIFGIMLYFLSPITNYFISNFSKAIKLREIRFFGLEHITMMAIAVALISYIAKKIYRRKYRLTQV